MSYVSRSLNALKHGGYSNLGVLPGEDPGEFTRFHHSLTIELDPSGPTERDVVLSLAKCLWRKSRLGIYGVTEAARKEWGPVFAERDNPYWDLTVQLIKKFCQDGERLNDAIQLHEATREALTEQLPHLKEFKTCCAAILTVESGGESEEELTRKGVVELTLASFGDQITTEALIKEIELDGRLDARIDRLLKRLWQLKAAKQMLGLGSTTRDGLSGNRKL